MQKQKRLKDFEITEVVRLYLTGDCTCASLGRLFGVTKAAINGLLRRRGVEINNDRAKLSRRYTINENYFDKIDTEEKAYFLGLLYADGYVHEKRNIIDLSLQKSDIDILDKFKIAIGSNKPLLLIKASVKNSNHQDLYRVSISSKKMSQTLIRLGCVQAKSLILKFPTEEQVPEYLLRHFIRGYFDGDGCFSTWYNKKNKSKSYRCSIVSSGTFCEQVMIFIMKQMQIGIGITQRRKENKITRNMVIDGRLQTYKFLNWIYDNSLVYLDRKYQKYIREKLPMVDLRFGKRLKRVV